MNRKLNYTLIYKLLKMFLKKLKYFQTKAYRAFFQHNENVELINICIEIHNC